MGQFSVRAAGQSNDTTVFFISSARVVRLFTSEARTCVHCPAVARLRWPVAFIEGVGRDRRCGELIELRHSCKLVLFLPFVVGNLLLEAHLLGREGCKVEGSGRERLGVRPPCQIVLRAIHRADEGELVRGRGVRSLRAEHQTLSVHRHFEGVALHIGGGHDCDEEIVRKHVLLVSVEANQPEERGRARRLAHVDPRVTARKLALCILLVWLKRLELRDGDLALERRPLAGLLPVVDLARTPQVDVLRRTEDVRLHERATGARAAHPRHLVPRSDAGPGLRWSSRVLRRGLAGPCSLRLATGAE